MSCILLSASSIELKKRKLFWLHNLLVHGGNDLCCNLIVQDRVLSPVVHRLSFIIMLNLVPIEISIPYIESHTCNVYSLLKSTYFILNPTLVMSVSIPF